MARTSKGTISCANLINSNNAAGSGSNVGRKRMPVKKLVFEAAAWMRVGQPDLTLAVPTFPDNIN